MTWAEMWYALWGSARAAVTIGGMLAAVQLLYVYWKDRRETRIARARFAYQLLDALFDDEMAFGLLQSLDYRSRPPCAKSTLADAFDSVFTGDYDIQNESQAHVYECTDALLFHLDRFEHAIRAKLTLFEDLKTPSAYYVQLLSPYKPRLERYANEAGYHRAVAFMTQFPAWRNAIPKHPISEVSA